MSQPFEENVKKLVSIYPEVAPLIIPFDPEKNNFCQTDASELNIKMGNDYCHSQQNAQEESNQWFGSLDLTNITLLVVYGFGLGYGYIAAKKWLDENPDHYIVFFEDNPVVFSHFLATDAATEMLDNSQVRVFFCPNSKIEDRFIHKIVEDFPLRSIKIESFPYYSRICPGQFEQKKANLYLKYQMSIGVLSEYVTWGESFYDNLYQNLADFNEVYQIKPFLEAFKGVPAIVCGAGPSLDKNHELLKTLSDKAIIFAGGTSMNALNAKGILPHFGFGVDPNWYQYTRVVANTAFEVPFIFRTRINHEAFRVIQGPKIYLPGSSGYDVGEWMDQKFGVEPFSMTEGMNVVHLSLSLASKMGCKPIICVGLDLSYAEDKSYAGGIHCHALHSRQKDFKTKNVDDELLVKSDIYGKPVFTQWRWVAESNWYPYFMKQNPKAKVVNATEGGIGLPGIKNLTLKEVSDTYLTDSYDISGWIHACTQEAYLPMNLNQDSIEELLKDLKESLDKSIQLSRDLMMKYLESSTKQNHSSEENPENELNEITEIKEKLYQEGAYKGVLSIFEEKFDVIYRTRLNEVAHNRKRYPLEKVREEELLMKAAKYEFVFQAAVTNLSLVMKVLKKIEIKKLSSSELNEFPDQNVHNETKKNAVYEYKERILTISDPELGLNISETFVPNREFTETFPDGKTKWKTLYKKNDSDKEVIHGPSRFLSDKGVLLSETWYLNGKKVGRAYYRYHTGSIYAELTFKNGDLHGTQYYYYPDGKIKSVLTYSEGKYNGDVDLYYRNGRKKRHFEFKNGEKHGQELMWNEEGIKIISARYDFGKPTGIAREWYDTGGLAREVVYGENNEQKEIHTWTPAGRPYNQDTSSSRDYFDKLTVETGNLTRSLDTLQNQLIEISKVLTRESQQNSTEMKLEMEKINTELEKLKQYGKEIAMQTGLENQDSHEILWKTPQTKQMTGDQIQAASESLSKDFQVVHNALKKIIDQIISNTDNDHEKPS